MGLLAAAFEMASRLHAGQVRKGTKIPYIQHPLEVAAIAMRHGASEVEAAAALLHDTVEDCGGAPVLAEIREKFGPEVASIVEACSDSLSENPEEKAPWRERKHRYLAHLEKAPAAVLLVSASDKLANASAIVSDMRAVGVELWSRFKTGRDGQLWYYGELLAMFQKRRAEMPEALVAELEAKIGEMRVEAFP